MNELEKMQKNWKEISMDDIWPEVRQLVLLWLDTITEEGADMFIANKLKLARDIQNLSVSMCTDAGKRTVLVALQREYIAHLEKELMRVSTFLHLHNMSASVGTVKRGKTLRGRISQYKNL